MKYRLSPLIRRSALVAFTVLLAAQSQVFAEDQKIDKEQLLSTCDAATWDAKIEEKERKVSKKGPIRRALHHTGAFLADEASATAQGVGRDMIFMFSVQDMDPYEGKPPTNKPYEVASFRLVDGSKCVLRKFPDASCRVEGGFADGTIIAPLSVNKFVVGYPNGARGMMVKTGAEIKVFRPDKTVTTFEKTSSGNYKIHNSEMGYMGEGYTDHTGLRYDFGSMGKGSL